MPSRFLLLLLAGWLLWPMVARADGKVFSQVTAKTATPDQRALLHFANGMETLVVETTFVGTGTNFAWVVPLPSAPEITAVPRTLFTNLERLFRPEIIHQQTRWWRGMLFVGIPALLAHFTGKRWKALTFVEWLITFSIFSLWMAIWMPNFVKSRGHSGIEATAPSVTVLAREQVGVFDVVTLKSPDGLALTRWLNENSFAVPAAATPVIADYAKQGWVFAAAKLSRADETGKTSPHPLAFKFKTDRAVYPLRLTGVENDHCLVELYVFGDARAELPGFKVELCLATTIPPLPSPAPDFVSETGMPAFSEPPPGELRIRHPALRSLVANAPVGTRLVGALSAEAMSRDAFLDWRHFKRELPRYFSPAAAVTRAVNFAGAIFLGGLLLHLLWIRIGGGNWSLRWMLATAGCALAVGVATFLSVETREIEVKSSPYFSPSGRATRWSMLDGGLQQLILDLGLPANRAEPPHDWNSETLKAALLTYFKGDYFFINAFTGEPMKGEATPGNLLFRRTERGTEVIWHDIDCVEHVLGTLPNRTP